MLIYKCRKCGKEYSNTHAPNISWAVSSIAFKFPLPKEWGAIKADLLDVHCCSDGEYGISDLIGGKED
jgi:hypothetical protein